MTYFLALLALLIPAIASAQIDVSPREGRRALMLNTAEVVGWSTELPFIDHMRSATTWVGHLPGQWGGVDEVGLEAMGALDENGWVVDFPRELAKVSTSILVDLPAGVTSTAGRYHAFWEGSAYLGFTGAARRVRYGDNSASFDFEPGNGAVFIEFSRGTLTNLAIVHERHLELFEAGAVFNPDWLARVGDATALRMLDWMHTNNRDIVHWDDRPRVSDYTWARRGVPLEIMLRLANETGAEPWFTLPHLADDDFVRRFASAVHTGLRDDLRAWFEYSNELWNWSFEQAQWAEVQATERWGDGVGSGWVQFAAIRAAHTMRLIDSVYAGDESRRVRVLGLFTGWLGLEIEMLEAPAYMAEDPAHRPPHEAFDAVAVTGYFTAELHSDDKRAMVMGWLDASRAEAELRATQQGLTGAAREAYLAEHRFNLAMDLAAQELLDGAVSGNPANSIRDLIDRTLTHHAAVARGYGLALVMYEGGTHLVVNPQDHDNSELIAFFETLNYSAQMGDLYRILIRDWATLTDAPFNAYADINRPTIWGSWGHLRHIDDDNPRWRALMEATAR